MIKRRLKLLIAGLLQRRVKRLFSLNPQLKLVAVGGSVGKTSTKLATAAVLAQKFQVNYYEGNYNDPISIPLSILGLEVPDVLHNPLTWPPILAAATKAAKSHYPYDVVLVELGTDQPGDIPHFMKYLHPDIGVVTATTPKHMLTFVTKTAVIKEEFSLARGSKLAILCGDDVGIRTHLEELETKAVTYGTSGQVHFSDHTVSTNGTINATLHIGGEVVQVKTNVVARHSLYALAAAAAVGHELGLTAAQIAAGIAKFKPVFGRMNPLPGVNSSLIIDDSYNSSPDAVIAALETLDGMQKSRGIAVLGSMNELGNYSREGHEQAGAACGDVDLLVTIGKDARDLLAPAAKQAGLGDDQIKSFLSPYEAASYLKPLVRSGDVILVKGSQNGVFSEETAAMLLRDPADRSKLVRQTPTWQHAKKEQFKDYE